jgi:hypothetical protein
MSHVVQTNEIIPSTPPPSFYSKKEYEEYGRENIKGGKGFGWMLLGSRPTFIVPIQYICIRLYRRRLYTLYMHADLHTVCIKNKY